MSEELPLPARRGSPTEVTFLAAVPLWDVVDDLGEWRQFTCAPTMDEVGHYTGSCSTAPR